MTSSKFVLALIIIISFSIVGSVVGVALAKLLGLQGVWLWAIGVGIFMVGIGSLVANYLLFR